MGLKKSTIGGNIMITKVHIHPKVEKMLEQLKKKENAPSIAAHRAQTIIQGLIKGIRSTRPGHFSKSKDARIRNLCKYNLGSGYRLICIKKKYNIYVLFVGSHDQCDTWLDKHRKRKPHKNELSMNIFDVDTSEISTSETLNTIAENKYDHFIVPEISQQDLRRVFLGLINCR